MTPVWDACGGDARVDDFAWNPRVIEPLFDIIYVLPARKRTTMVDGSFPWARCTC